MFRAGTSLVSSLWSPSSLLSGELCLECPSDSVALRTRVPSCPEHPHTSFTLGGAGGAARSKKAEDIWTAHTNPLQNLQLLLSTCSLLTACLMRNKLLHKQAKNTSKRENQKAWETKAKRWTSRAHGKPDLSPWRSQWRAQQKQISLHGLQKFSFKGKISPYPAACTHSWTATEHWVCVTLQKQRTSVPHSLSNWKKHYLQA